MYSCIRAPQGHVQCRVQLYEWTRRREGPH